MKEARTSWKHTRPTHLATTITRLSSFLFFCLINNRHQPLSLSPSSSFHLQIKYTWIIDTFCWNFAETLILWIYGTARQLHHSSTKVSIFQSKKYPLFYFPLLPRYVFFFNLYLIFFIWNFEHDVIQL